MKLVIDERPDGVAVASWPERTALDASNAEEMRRQLGEVSQRCPRLVLDMSTVDFVDSSIIGALVGLLRRTRAAGGDTKLVTLTPEVETIFELTRLQRVFRVLPSVEDAVRDFQTPVGQ